MEPPGNVTSFEVNRFTANALVERDNAPAKWGRAYKTRLGYTANAHKQAVAGVGKRIIQISYHILRMGTLSGVGFYKGNIVIPPLRAYSRVLDPVGLESCHPFGVMACLILYG